MAMTKEHHGPPETKELIQSYIQKYTWKGNWDLFNAFREI